MDTRWALILTAPVFLVLVAWISWLLFNLVIAKWFGVEGLQSTPAIARAFRPRDWAVLIPRFRQHSGDSELGTPAEASEGIDMSTEGDPA